MTSKPQVQEEHNALKGELIQANLKTAIDFGKLALLSNDEGEIARYRKTACDAYEEALYTLRTATLTHIEWESIKTKMEHLESALMVSEATL